MILHRHCESVATKKVSLNKIMKLGSDLMMTLLKRNTSMIKVVCILDNTSPKKAYYLLFLKVFVSILSKKAIFFS